MIEKFKKYIFDVCGIKPDAKIILAISGGLDSCVLLDLFLKSNIKIALAHCNFKLRGNESDENELFVKKLAQKHHLSFFVTNFDTQTLQLESKDSIQMIARKLRYDWFQTLLSENNFDFIATAHHKNDNLETVILNFTRGTGISGFHGIKPNQNQIIRPLLFASREEIRQYAIEKNIDYQEDSSNSSIKYHRNLIRHEVIPKLKTINPNLENTVEQTIEKIKVVEQIYADFIKDFSEKCIAKNDTYIEIDILSCKKHEPFVLFSIIESYGFNYVQSKQILNCDVVGNIFYSIDYQLVIDRKKYIISKKAIKKSESILIQNFDSDVVFENQILKFEPVFKKDFKPERNANIIYLSKNTKFPLTLRPWQNGDFIQPFGMKGKKNVSNILIDAKVSVSEKETVFVLASESEIIWVIGYTFSEKYKIISDCEEIIKLILKFRA